MGMKVAKRVCFKALIVAFLVGSLVGIVGLQVNAAEHEVAPTVTQDLVQGKELFFKARKMYYNAEAPLDETKKALYKGKESFNQLADGFEKFYWCSQVEFVLAETAEYSGDKKQAAEGFNTCELLIRKALNYDKNSSDANRLLADTIMRLTNYKGAFYTMTHGPQACNMLKHALELDKKNFTAYDSLGVYYINAPVIGGGSMAKGIQTLQNALESKDEFDNFISHVWLGQAYQKKKDSDQAVKYLKKALEIYPNSPWAKGLLKQIEKNSK